MHNTTEDKSSVTRMEYTALSDVFLSRKSFIPYLDVSGRVNFSSDNPFPSPLAAESEIRTLRVGRNHGGPSLVALRVVEGQSHVIRARERVRYEAAQEARERETRAREELLRG